MLAEDMIEREIAELEQSDFVRLARKEKYIRERRLQRLYTLRCLDKKGRELAEKGITIELLERIDSDESDSVFSER